MMRSIQIPTSAAAAPILVLLSLLLTLTSCSSGQVRGEAPFAQLSNWKLEGETLNVDLRLRNVNDEAMELERLALNVSLDNATILVQHQQPLDLDIAPGGFETIGLELFASDEGVQLLERLSSGEIASLRYALEGTVSATSDGDLTIRRSDRIYRVPGRPGEFR